MTSERSRKLQRALILTALSAWVAGCALLVPDRGAGPHELPFNHLLHVQEFSLACAECHVPDGDGAPTMPPLSLCRDCHDEGEEITAEYFAGMAVLRSPDAPFTVYTAAISSEVLSAHATHEKAGVDCASCHGDVGTMKATNPSVVPPMATCVACHEDRAPERLDCATCHVTIRKDESPTNHKRDWRREHGAQARYGAIDPLMGGTCSYCHERDTCVECHRREQPRTHDNFFIVRGHGLMAENDRQACAACHQPDMCIRCHQTTEPTSHSASWGSSANGHCRSCHLPVQSESGCAMCHQATPSHSQGAPMPPDHEPGMTCRQCHGRGQPLPHPDNGTECATCHR